MTDEFRLLQRKVDRLNPAIGDIRDRLVNCCNVASRPEDALALARGVAESVTKEVLAAIHVEAPATFDNCLRMLEKPEVMSRGLVPAEIITLLHTIRTFGNKATHDAFQIRTSLDLVQLVLRSLLSVVEWYTVEFERGPKLCQLYQDPTVVQAKVASERKRPKVAFVSRNKQKFDEYRHLLQDVDLSLTAFEIPDLQEMNLEVLVRRKVEHAKPVLGTTPFFVEHTGLIIDAWKGLPGGLTATFMNTVGSAGICKMLAGFRPSERMARAKTLIAYHSDDTIHVFEGAVSGRISPEPRGGTTGSVFGWNDIFIPEGETATYSELGIEKYRISMRQRAAEAFGRYLALKAEDE